MSDLTETTATSGRSHAQDLVDFIWESPSPFHCVDTVNRRLETPGFVEFDESAAPIQIAPGSCALVDRGGAIGAWCAGTKSPVEHGFRVAVAHTDSWTLRVKPVPDASKEGYQPVGMAMLSMHSVRERSGTEDVLKMKKVIQYIYEQG